MRSFLPRHEGRKPFGEGETSSRQGNSPVLNYRGVGGSTQRGGKVWTARGQCYPRCKFPTGNRTKNQTRYGFRDAMGGSFVAVPIGNESMGAKSEEGRKGEKMEVEGV